METEKEREATPSAQEQKSKSTGKASEVPAENPEQEQKPKSEGKASAVPAENPGKKEKKKKPATEKTDADLERLQKEFEAHKQQHLRVLAEYDNFRKRSQKEKDERYNNGVIKAVGAILPVADNLERALGQENASVEDLKKGVEMVLNQLNVSLEELGVKPVGQAGEPFDPNLHNAVAHIEDESLGENVIAAVYQKGYLLGDHVVRHAMVQVAN